MTKQEEIRNAVSDFYSRALTGCGCGCSGTVQKGVAAKTAGYSEQELAGLPTDAVLNSFGCGNPLAFSGVREGDVVLDLGSGAGIDLLIAAKKVGTSGRVIGIDMTDDMIERATTNVKASGLSNIEVRKGIIEQMPVEKDSIDWVISNCVINLSPDKPRVFAEIFRVLKPGGQVSISDIVATDLPEWVLKDMAAYASCVAGAISEEKYLEGLRHSGLVDVEVTDRIVYDTDQLVELVSSEVPAEKLSCCGGAIPKGTLNVLASTVKGKVWSARFKARKP